MDAYITDISAFLPNAPVSNEEIDKVLGTVSRMPSRIKNIVLASNNIRRRYYAIDPVTGNATHTNVQLTAEAIRRLMPYEGFSLKRYRVSLLRHINARPVDARPRVDGPRRTEKLPPARWSARQAFACQGVAALKYALYECGPRPHKKRRGNGVRPCIDLHEGVSLRG